MKWEYCCVCWDASTVNELGFNGWELVSVTCIDDVENSRQFTVAYFKRPLRKQE